MAWRLLCSPWAQDGSEISVHDSKHLLTGFVSHTVEMLTEGVRPVLQIFTRSHKLSDINDDYWDVRAEPVPEEEMNPSATSRTIHVYHIAPGPGPGVSPSLAACPHDLPFGESNVIGANVQRRGKLKYRCGPLLDVWLRISAVRCTTYDARPWGRNSVILEPFLRLCVRSHRR